MITRQDIIDMANEAQLDDSIWIDEPDCKPIDDLVKFSELVQKKVAKMCYIQEQIAVGLAVNAAIMREREACAKLAKKLIDQGWFDVATEILARNKA